MWFHLFDGATAVSAGQQQFTGDDKGYFEAPDHLHPAIVASGGAIAVGPHHPDHPPQPAEPTVIEGPAAVDVSGALGTGPVNLPSGDYEPPEDK
jgi:hypothetical protein